MANSSLSATNVVPVPSSSRKPRAKSTKAANVLQKEHDSSSASVTRTTVLSNQQVFFVAPSTSSVENQQKNTKNILRPWPFPTGIPAE